MKSNFKFKTSLAAAAMVSSVSAFAVPLTGAAITGTGTTFTQSGSTFVSAAYSNLSGAALNALLAGDITSPGGNVELNKLGAGLTSLTGYYGTTAITLSSLTAADWAGGLATQYITAAATSIGATLTGAQMTAATNIFLGGGYWRLISDPNLSYVDVAGGTLNIGLAGYYDATPVLAGLFSSFGVVVPAGSQASEVVKVTVNGVSTYLYSFDAEPSFLATNDGLNSFTGTYAVSLNVPEPGSFALFGLALAGLAVARRKAKKQA